MAHSDRPLVEAFGRVVRDRRHDAGISQMELALAAGLASSFVSQIENGLRGVSLETIAGLAKALDTSAEDLIGAAERSR
ncbi:MAG: helix-turn-helix transcriptional regulator [Chloroflexi bacterium]|nr:helix-turn-helix transcriptional regulator [Chloroflexota bacterium]